MANKDNIIKRSPLDGFKPFDNKNIKLTEKRFLTKLQLRGDINDKKFTDAVTATIGIELPKKPCHFNISKDYQACWMAHDEWLILASEDQQQILLEKFQQSLSDDNIHASITDVSDYYVMLDLSGNHAIDILTKATPLDLHSSKFDKGMCSNIIFAKATIFLMQSDDKPSAYNIMIRWSMADYLWDYLHDGAREFA